MLWSWERRESDAHFSGEQLQLGLIWMGSFCDKVGTEGSLRATGCRQKTGSQSKEAPDKENIYVLAYRILNPNIRVSRASAVNRHIGLGN